ncbi:hypothetical protein MMC31_007614 [Peltigera leucophlebia]|nr:hypothetical protein [Peltigera leucophlebia]
MNAMDDDLVVATSSTSNDNDYGFVVTVRPGGTAVSLRLKDICEPDGNSTELTSLRREALYEAVNKKLNEPHVTPDSHCLSDLSRHITDDDKLQKVLAFEGQYIRLFRWFLNPTLQELASPHHHEQNLPPTEAYEDDSAESEWEGGPETMAFDQYSAVFQQSLKQSQAKFEQWKLSRWAETKRVYARIEEEKSGQFEYFKKIPWSVRPILPHQAYAAIFMIQTEAENHGVLLADEMGSGKTASCWLALATIAIAHKTKRNHHQCTTQSCLAMPNDMRTVGSFATDDIICPTKSSDTRQGKKIPSIITETRLPTLIVTPPILVPIWQREYEKTVLPGVLELRTTHLRQHASLADLYQPLQTDGKEQDGCKDNVVILTSKTSLETRIMDDKVYHQYPSAKHPKPVGKLRFARVLVDEAHDIRGINTAFFKNLVKLAADGASIWFITATPLPKGAKSLAGCMKCWDATAFVKNLRDPLSDNLGQIDKGYINAFRQNAVAQANEQQAVADATRKEMEQQVEKLAKIMLKFTIQRTRNTLFLNKKIIDFPLLVTLTEWVKFPDHGWETKYQAFNSKDIKKMKEFAVQAGQNFDDRIRKGGFDHMRMNRIYAGIPGLLEMPGNWTTEQLKAARLKSHEEGSSAADWVRFIDNRAFSPKQIDFLVKSSSKLQRLIEILGEFKIGERLPALEPKGNKSPDKSPTEPLKNPPGIRKVVIIALYPVECEIIEWAIRDKTGLAVAHLQRSLNNEERQRLTNEAFQGDDPVLSFVTVLVGSLTMMGQGVTLTKAQLAVVWSPQWTGTHEAQAFGRITRLGQDRETTCIRLLASGTIDKHVNDMQQQRQGFDIRVLGFRVEGQETLTDKEELTLYTV